MLPIEVFFNEQSLANILSFATVASKFSITVNTQLYPSTNVHLHHAVRMIFKKCGWGLYSFDTTNEAFDEEKTTD